jgi:hypothetical protein
VIVTKKLSARLALVFMVMALLLPVSGAAAQGGGTTLYLPAITKAPPVPVPAVLQVGPTGGTFPGVAVDPTNANIVYAGSYGAGMYKSSDAGLTWQAINNGLSNWSIQTVSLTPDGGTLFAGTYGSGIFRSQDGGANWTAVNNGFPATTVGGFIVYDIEISPANPATLYASIRESGTFEMNGSLVGYVLKSVNSGESWSVIWTGWMANPNRGDYSYDVDLRASDGTLFLATHENGIFKLPSGSATWVKLQNDSGYAGAENLSSRNVVVNGTTVLNSIYKLAGVYKSTNDGVNWTMKTSGLNAIYGFALEKDPANPAVLYLSTANNGLYKSADSGENWSAKGLVGTYIWRFSIVPSNTQQIFAGTSGNGVQVSGDGGNSWQWRGDGVYNTNISGLAALPSQPGTIFAGTFGAGVYRSSDNGATWQRVISGLGDLNVKALPVINGKLYAVTATNLYVSTDGLTWSAEVTMAPSAQSAPEAQVENGPAYSQLILQPEEELLLRADPVAPEVDGSAAIALNAGKAITAAAPSYAGLWVGTAGAGIKLRGDFECNVNDGQTVYALHNHNGELWASIDKYDIANGVLKYYIMRWNPNGGQCNWDTTMTGISTSVKVNAFASSPGQLLAATSAGVYINNQSTHVWSPASGLVGAVYAISADPNVSGRVYAAAESGAYVSNNQGSTWQAVPRAELQGRAYVSVLVDPQNSNLVYFGSREGSTFRWDLTLP